MMWLPESSYDAALFSSPTPAVLFELDFCGLFFGGGGQGTVCVLTFYDADSTGSGDSNKL